MMNKGLLFPLVALKGMTPLNIGKEEDISSFYDSLLDFLLLV